MATAALHVPVEEVTLDARLVAETIAGVWTAAARIVAFNGGECTPTSDELDEIGEELYKASFAIECHESGSIAGLWGEILRLAETRAKDASNA